MAANANNTVTEAPKPDARLRSSTPIIAGAAIGCTVIAIGGILGGALPLFRAIGASNENRQYAEAETASIGVELENLEVQRDSILEQYDAIALFVDRYPNAPEQDTLFRDIENSAIFAGTKVTGVSTEYPQLLEEGNYEAGAIVTPDQIVIGGAAESETEAAGETIPGVANPDTEVQEGDTDTFPLGTIPLSLQATIDGTVAFEDNVGTTYVASPSLGYFTYGGETERSRLTMAGAVQTSVADLNSTFFADSAGAGTAGWSTVFRPDMETVPYRELDDPSALDAQELVTIFPSVAGVSDVAVPAQWSDNNGYLPLGSISQTAWLIDEIQNSPGRAILIKFAAASGSEITLSGQQFILRDLPPLPEEIFGDLNEDGVTEGDFDAATGEIIPSPTPTPTPSPVASATAGE